MRDEPLMTADDFLEQLRQGARWIELCQGGLVRYRPPADSHRWAAYNLLLAIGKHLQTLRRGSVCAEVGLILERGPDTVLCPAISCFHSVSAFAGIDDLVTDATPVLVVDCVSSTERRERAAGRVRALRNRGVETIWLLDPASRSAAVHRQDGSEQLVDRHGTLDASPHWPELRIPVNPLFEDPFPE